MENLKLFEIEKFDDLKCVHIYKNAFNTGNLIDLIDEESKREWPYIEWGRSRTGDGQEIQLSEHRTSLEIDLGIVLQDEVSDDLRPLRDYIIDNLLVPIDECVWDYRNIYDLQLRQNSGFHLLKYQLTDEYHIHYDHAPMNQRVISMVACLSDNFEGGELEFPYHNKTFKLEKNSLIIFPSNFPYAHIAHPVTEGVKYSLVTWYI